MTDIKPELIEKAADIIEDALDNHGHNGIDCRPDAGMDLYVTAATRAALSAVADDLRAEGAVQALREAADAWQVSGWAADVPPAGADRPALILGMAQRATNFLRARADRIEARDA